MGEPAPAPIPNQRWLRIIPAAFVMYTIAFVDRTNIALALGPMSRDLHMDPARAGDAAGFFSGATCSCRFRAAISPNTGARNVSSAFCWCFGEPAPSYAA